MRMYHFRQSGVDADPGSAGTPGKGTLPGKGEGDKDKAKIARKEGRRIHVHT